MKLSREDAEFQQPVLHYIQENGVNELNPTLYIEEKEMSQQHVIQSICNQIMKSQKADEPRMKKFTKQNKHTKCMHKYSIVCVHVNAKYHTPV